jgi:hypothetical protein
MKIVGCDLHTPGDQLSLSGFAGLRVQPGNLLPAGMKITTYNQHGRLLPPRGLVLKPRLFWPEVSLRPYPINISLFFGKCGLGITPLPIPNIGAPPATSLICRRRLASRNELKWLNRVQVVNTLQKVASIARLLAPLTTPQ